MKPVPARFLLGGAGLVVLANAIALGCVLYNRTGPADASLRLTQRELQVTPGPLRDGENTGLALTIRWQVPGSCDGGADSYGTNRIAAWLDESRLHALGVRTGRRPVRDGVMPGSVESLPVEVFFALELDGPAYAKQVEEACAEDGNGGRDDGRSKACTYLREKASRLILVDAGTNPDELRDRYPDRTKYAIVRGQVRAIDHYGSCGEKVVGMIPGIANPEITVPLALRAPFEAGATKRATSDGGRDAPFEALVQFGRLREPWLQEVR